MFLKSNLACKKVNPTHHRQVEPGLGQLGENWILVQVLHTLQLLPGKTHIITCMFMPNIGSDNGLVLSGTKALPYSMLNQIMLWIKFSIQFNSIQTRRSENDDTPQHEYPIHGPTDWKLIYLPCTVGQEEAHCPCNIVSNSHLFHSKSIDLPIPKIWQLKIWPWKSKVEVMGEVKV